MCIQKLECTLFNVSLSQMLVKDNTNAPLIKKSHTLLIYSSHKYQLTYSFLNVYLYLHP